MFFTLQILLLNLCFVSIQRFLKELTLIGDKPVVWNGVRGIVSKIYESMFDVYLYFRNPSIYFLIKKLRFSGQLNFPPRLPTPHWLGFIIAVKLQLERNTGVAVVGGNCSRFDFWQSNYTSLLLTRLLKCRTNELLWRLLVISNGTSSTVYHSKWRTICRLAPK